MEMYYVGAEVAEHLVVAAQYAGAMTVGVAKRIYLDAMLHENLIELAGRLYRTHSYFIAIASIYGRCNRQYMPVDAIH
jgi:hypothetical protein